MLTKLCVNMPRNEMVGSNRIPQHHIGAFCYRMVIKLLYVVFDGLFFSWHGRGRTTLELAGFMPYLTIMGNCLFVRWLFLMRPLNVG